MKEEYDFSTAIKNPYIKKLKKPSSINTATLSVKLSAEASPINRTALEEKITYHKVAN